MAEFQEVVARNPFAKRSGIEPGKLLVNFLAADPGKEAREKALAIKIGPEEMHLIGREAYIYFPNGQGRSKFPWPAIERALGTSGTGRNWNSVTKMLEMAEKMEPLIEACSSPAPGSHGCPHKSSIIHAKFLKAVSRLGIYSPPVFSDFLMNWRNDMPQAVITVEQEWARALARFVANQLPQAVSQVRDIQLNADQVAVLQSGI